MNRRQKEEVVDLLKDNFQKCNASFLVGYKGLSVPQMQLLRSDLKKEDASLKVSKARLIKRAAHADERGALLVPFLKDQVALIFASKETPGVAKILKEFAKKNEALQVIAASFENRLLDNKAVERIASLPSKKELLAHVCGALNAPVVKMATVLRLLVLRLLWTIKSIEAKKQQG